MKNLENLRVYFFDLLSAPSFGARSDATRSKIKMDVATVARERGFRIKIRLIFGVYRDKVTYAVNSSRKIFMTYMFLSTFNKMLQLIYMVRKYFWYLSYCFHAIDASCRKIRTTFASVLLEVGNFPNFGNFQGVFGTEF